MQRFSASISSSPTASVIETMRSLVLRARYCSVRLGLPDVAVIIVHARPWVAGLAPAEARQRPIQISADDQRHKHYHRHSRERANSATCASAPSFPQADRHGRPLSASPDGQLVVEWQTGRVDSHARRYTGAPIGWAPGPTAKTGVREAYSSRYGTNTRTRIGHPGSTRSPPARATPVPGRVAARAGRGEAPTNKAPPPGAAVVASAPRVGF